MLSRTPWLRRAACLLALTCAAAPASAQQTVFLDFSQPTQFGPGLQDFSQADRDIIQAAVERDFRAFNFSFTQTAPISGDFSTIRYNVGSTISSVSKVDFRNTDRNDVGLVNTAAEFDSFFVLDEFEFPNLLIQQENFLQFTANITSRTVGQLVGLETFDALGGIGSGLSPDPGFLADPSLLTQDPLPAVAPIPYNTGFFGPTNGSAAEQHLSGSRVRFFEVPVIDPITGEQFIDPITMEPRVEGVYEFEADKRALIQRDPLDDTSPIDLVQDQFFGPREAIKLAFNEQATAIPELPGADKQLVPFGATPLSVQVQPLQLTRLLVPTTAETGQLAREVVTSDAVAVTGQIVPQDIGQRDYYSFTASAGDVVNIEVKSDLLERFEDEIDPVVAVLDSNFQPIDYFGVDAINDDELVRAISPDPTDPLAAIDSFNARLLDLIIPADGEYFIEIQAFRPNGLPPEDTGEYELFFHNSRAVAAPVGDFNVDGIVDVADYALWRDTLDDDVVPGTGADADNNGKIDVNDFDLWVANFGERVDFLSTNATSNAQTVPEPSAAGLALLALLAGAARRRG